MHVGFIPPIALPRLRDPRKRPRSTCSAASNASPSDEVPQFASRFGPPSVPESIKRLDMLEFQRRQEATPNPSLPPEVLESLFDKYPSIKKFHEAMQQEMQRDDYDPDDFRVYSWAYGYLRPRAMGRPLQALISFLLAYSTVKLVQYVRSRVSQLVLMNALVTADTVFTAAFAAVVPMFLCSWALYRARRNAVRTDGVRRSIVMFCLTAIALPGAWAMAATSNVGLAIVSSIFVRCMLFIPIWNWIDIRREASIGDALLAKVYRAWRFVASVTVLGFGNVLRILSLCVPHEVPGTVFGQKADGLRRALGKRFPVSCSLCNDPRGLFLLGGLVVMGLVAYTLYLLIFVTDCGRVNCHRECESVLTSFCVKKGIYQPNRHPGEVKNSLAAPNPDASFRASPPMLLRPDEDQLATNSAVMADKNMPIFAYLDKEEEIMKQTGVTQWLKYRSKQVPAYTEEEKEERDDRALLSWARPLAPEEEKLSIEDYFQTVEDDEYFYDPTTGNWVFVEGEGKDDDSKDKPENVLDLDGEDDEVLEIPEEWAPIIQKIMEGNKGEGGDKLDSQDDEDSPFTSVYV
ncbi:hypothetical protein FGB62_373g06 [Gracilaria domingensis]|nr:hypothetical protein FGB62_373g06 [Gracilaria domingensis]